MRREDRDYWRSMTRAEFDRDHAQGFTNGGVLYPWCQLTWVEKIVRVTVVIPLWCAAVVGGFIAIITVLGMMMEGVTEHRTELDRCKRQAVTPQEYHECR